MWEKISKWIPRPFKYLQRRLDIQHEWAQFKNNLKPHRYKLRVGLLVITYPLYQSYLKMGIERAKANFSEYLKKESQPSEPAFQWVQNVLKHLLSHIFTDDKVKGEALDFVFSLIQNQKFMSQILQLLVSAFKSQSFMKELKISVKDLLVQELQNEEVQASINKLLKNIAGNQQIKKAFIKLIQDVFSSQQSIDTIVNLLKKGVAHDDVKGALAQSVNFTIREVLSDEETLNLLKIFIFFLLRKFQNDEEIKGMMDIIFAKGLGLFKKKKQSALQKILKPKKNQIV